MADGILLQSGHLYSYLNPECNVFTIEDIALGLSHVCRFGGHLEKHYSVAQHSWYVSHAVDQRFALAGLLHDGVEAFLCDIPSPLKAFLKDYRAIEQLHERELFRRMDLPYPIPAEVHLADKQVLAAEVRDLRPASVHWAPLKDVVAYDQWIKPWSPKKAREQFLARYYDLTGARTVH